MMAKGKRKPMTVEAISGAPEHAEQPLLEMAITKGERSGGQRAHVKQLTLYLPHPVYRQLRQLAFHEEKRMHSLLIEALDRLFADRGTPSIEQLTRKL